MIHKDIADKYRVLRLLQHGIAGDILLVEHKALTCRRILKIIERNHPHYDFLVKEARVLQQFCHPSIPIIYDICEYDTKTYLIEEFIEGENLKQYFQRQGSLSEVLLLNYSIQLCEILQYIHGPAHRILHLDIKPENMLLSDYQLKLIDFGSAICQKKDELNTAYFGSPGFAAPEQMTAGALSEETDIYGLGKLMQYMLFYAEKVPKGFPEIVQNCLRTGAKRYTSADQVKQDLQRLKLKKTRKQPMEQWYAVAGIPTGYHSTVFALQLADYLKRRHKKSVLILDCNSVNGMEQLENYETTSSEAQKSFVYERNNITIAKRVAPQEVKGWRGRGYSYIICDFGNLSVQTAGIPFTRCFCTGSMTAWTVDFWKQYLEELNPTQKNALIITEGDAAMAHREFGGDYEIGQLALLSAIGTCSKEGRRIVRRFL